MADKKAKILQVYGVDKPKSKAKKTTASGKRGSKVGEKTRALKEVGSVDEPYSPEVDDQFPDDEEGKLDPGSAHLPHPEDATDEEGKQLALDVSLGMEVLFMVCM